MEKFHGGIQSIAELHQRWDALKLGDLTGKRVLDVGAAEGWFSKKCLDAGAEFVQAWEPVRLCDLSLYDDRWATVHQIPFDTPCSIPNPTQTNFDIVLMLRVLYHMKIPQLALARVAWMLKPGGVLYLESWFDDPEDDSYTMRMYLDEPDKMRFVPSPDCLMEMLHFYGFEDISIIHTYQGDHRQIWRTKKKPI